MDDVRNKINKSTTLTAAVTGATGKYSLENLQKSPKLALAQV